MNSHELKPVIPNPWFVGRRDYFVRQVVEEFMEVQRSFEDIYRVYLNCRTPYVMGCTDLLDERGAENRKELWDQLAQLVGTETGKGTLWLLKDLCHQVWPEGEEERDTTGSLFDWLVGSIFHETMKLKENIYLLNRYGPAACRIKESPVDPLWQRTPRGAVSIEDRNSDFIDVNGLITRAAGDAILQMEQVAFLFSHASYILRLKMADLAGNALVVRLLVEQEEKIQLLWGEKTEDIFRDMYFGDAAEGFCLAGRSYLSGQWFARALKVYQQALAVDATCDEAITRMVQLQAVVRENRELLGTA